MLIAAPTVVISISDRYLARMHHTVVNKEKADRLKHSRFQNKRSRRQHALDQGVCNLRLCRPSAAAPCGFDILHRNEWYFEMDWNKIQTVLWPVFFLLFLTFTVFKSSLSLCVLFIIKWGFFLLWTFPQTQGGLQWVCMYSSVLLLFQFIKGKCTRNMASSNWKCNVQVP